jgi:hypothetical protein
VRQQINLYQPIFNEKRAGFSAVPVALGLLALCCGLAAYSFNSNLRVKKLALELSDLQARQAQEQAQRADDSQPTPSDLENRIKRLSDLVRDRGQALELLQSGGAGTTIGFAPRLEALARRHVEGVWIDSLRLSGSSGAMNIAGAAFDADRVPVYLQSLATDKTLAGTRFDDFVIERKVVEAVLAGDEASGEPKPARQTQSKQIRFRAGSTSLKVAEPEVAS